MRKLLRHSEVIDGHHCTVVEHAGEGYLVRDDFETAMAVRDALISKDMNPFEKWAFLACAAFVDADAALSNADVSGLVSKVAWECYGIDIDGSRSDQTGGDDILDWDEDAGRIKASLLMSYGVKWDELVNGWAYRDVVSMVGMVEHDTPLGQAMYYRSAEEPKLTKYNEDEVKRFRELRAHYRLERGGTGLADRLERMSGNASDAFASLRRAAGA